MGNIIEISTEQLNTDIQTVQENINKIKSEISALTEEVSKLNGMWSGPANQVYNQQAAEDFAKINSLMEAIGKFEQHMEFAVQQYNKCEQSVAEKVAAIRI